MMDAPYYSTMNKTAPDCRGLGIGLKSFDAGRVRMLNLLDCIVCLSVMIRNGDAPSVY
jgi:hypothetical protein